MAIRLRLALLFAAGTALLIGTGGFLFVGELSGGLRNSVAVGLQARNQAISQSLNSGNFNVVAEVPGPTASAGAGAGEQDDALQVIGPAGQLERASGLGQGRLLVTPAQLAQSRRDRVLLQESVPGADAPLMLLASPTGRSGLVVVTGTTLDTVDEAVRRVVIALAIGGPLGVLAAGAAAWLIAGAALRPVERMRRQAADISAHDDDTALVVPTTRDEIARLGNTLNDLLDRLQGALSRQRGFVAAAGHELRTPLANLKVELELAARPSRSRSDLAAAVVGAAAEVDRLTRLAEDLLLLARSDESTPIVVPVVQDVRAVVAASVQHFAEDAARRRVAVELTSDPRVLAPVDAERYRQIVDNLLDNAIHHAPSDSTVALALRSSGDEVILDVLDQGLGFPPEYLPYAFERFTRPDGGRDRERGGVGLGLAIVKALTEAHGGRVEAANRPPPIGGALLRVITPGAHRNGRVRN